MCVEGKPRFVATVLSRSFEDQDEAERQSAAWAHLRSRFPEDDLPRIESIFLRARRRSGCAREALPLSRWCER